MKINLQLLVAQSFFILLLLSSFSLMSQTKIHVGVIGSLNYNTAIESNNDVVVVGNNNGVFVNNGEGRFIDPSFNPAFGITTDIMLGEESYNPTFLNIGIIYRPTELKYSNDLTFDFTYLEIPVGVVSYLFTNKRMFATGHIAPTILIDDSVKLPQGLVLTDSSFNTFDVTFKGGFGMHITDQLRARMGLNFGIISFVEDYRLTNVYVGLDLEYFLNK
jgi:hypothetical protein